VLRLERSDQMNSIDIVNMTISHYDRVVALLKDTPGVVLRTSDSYPATARYLARNPGMSMIATHEGRIVGCVLCAHDGRRGYLQHLAVLPSFRNRGIGSALVERCLSQLERFGIAKAHVDVLDDNAAGHLFWSHRGWIRRDDIVRYSFTNSADPNA
jgi:ribosomal protein S18 acetylase RimI-like enzyme